MNISKIIGLKAENILRLQAVEIAPDGNLVIIGGENGQGKTSVLDSIWFTLGGEGTLPPEPVHRGAKKGWSEVNLGDLLVTRTINASGTTSLKVVGLDGKAKLSPQTLLDSLVGRLSFDPLEFSRMKSAEQASTVRTLVGLDFSEYEKVRQQTYDQRTEVGRELLNAQQRLMPLKRNVGYDVLKSPEEIIARQSAAIARNDRRKDALQTSSNAASLYQSAKNETYACRQLIQSTDAEIARLQALQVVRRGELQVLAGAEADRLAKLSTAQRIVEEFPPAEDITPFVTELQDLEVHNSKVRENQEFDKLSETVKMKSADVEQLTRELEELDAEKVKAISEAAFPLPGLSFDVEGSVTYNGLPFSQCSAAERLQVSVAIGLALNPKLRVLLIRDGSLLDSNSMQKLDAMARAAKAQIWVERVGTGDAGAVIIEDGKVKA